MATKPEEWVTALQSGDRIPFGGEYIVVEKVTQVKKRAENYGTRDITVTGVYDGQWAVTITFPAVRISPAVELEPQK